MRFIFIFISVLLFSLKLNAVDLNDINDLVQELESLNNKQQEVLVKTFIKAKDYSLGYTMSAICWQESKFGKYLVNLSDPSFGPFHNYIKSVQKRHLTNEWNTDRLVERLLFDYDFAFNESLTELQFWQIVYMNLKGSSSNTVASYNAGYNHENGKRYLQNIRNKIRALRIYFKKHNFEG